MMKGERRGASRAEASERRIWKNKDKEHTKNERGQREGREGRGWGKRISRERDFLNESLVRPRPPYYGDGGRGCPATRWLA